MIRPLKTAAVAAAVTAAAVGASVLAAAPAAAAGPCGSGYSLVGHYPLKRTGSSFVPGYYDVYWNGSARRNCGVVTSTGVTYGVAKFMAAYIDANSSPAAWDDVDSGTYRYYAGPVYTAVQPTSGSCISIQGYITWGGVTYGVDRGGLHCG